MAGRGYTILELLFTIAVGATIAAIAIPLMGSALDAMRTVIAARYVEGRIMHARIDAIRRSAAVGLRFQPADVDYYFAPYMDGNGNGIRTADIRSGVDAQQAGAVRLGDQYPGVRFQLMEGVPDIDGVEGGTRDGLRIGSARILTMNPNGTSTSGTLYVRGRRTQYAVRVFGVTGRTRVLQYHMGERRWISR